MAYKQSLMMRITRCEHIVTVFLGNSVVDLERDLARVSREAKLIGYEEGERGVTLTFLAEKTDE